MRPPCRELGRADRPPAPQVQSPLTWATTGPVGGARGLTRDVITGQRARNTGMEHQLPRAGDVGAAILRAGPWEEVIAGGSPSGTSSPHHCPSTLPPPCPPPVHSRVSRVLGGPPGSVAQVRPPFWGGWHSRWRAVTPPHGSEHGDQRDQEVHTPSSVGSKGRPVGWGAAVRLGEAQRPPPLPPCSPQAPPATLGSWHPSDPLPGQAAAKQARVWRSGPGQCHSTGRLGGEQRRLRPCTPGPHVRLHSSQGLQGPQAPQPCSSGEGPAVPASSQSGCPSHTWGQNSRVRATRALMALGALACRTTRSPASPAGNRCRGHPGRSILGREALSGWGLLGPAASLREEKRKHLGGRESHVPSPHQTWPPSGEQHAHPVLTLETGREPIPEPLRVRAQLGSQITGEETPARGQLGGACKGWGSKGMEGLYAC